MISRSQIKFITSLSHKKYRKAHQMFVAEGAKIAEEVLQSQIPVENLFAAEEWIASNAELLKGVPKDKIQSVDERQMEQVSQLSTPSPVLLVLRLPEYEYSPPGEGLNLCLESIRDPGNMGTIIRLADWYGMGQLYCSEDCVDAYNPKVVQASMGSIVRVQVHYVSSLEETIFKPGLKTYAAVLSGELNLHQLVEVNKDCILLIGNESQGLSESALSRADYRISIPRFGQAESLNAATATAVLLDNFKRLSKM
jgi:RNA methyltransferase, TrmH family